MIIFKILFSSPPRRAALAVSKAVLFWGFGYVCLFSSLSVAQSPPPAPRNTSPKTIPAWNPPATRSSFVPSSTLVADGERLQRQQPYSPEMDRPQTTLTNLKPPRDIFTQPSPAAEDRLAARPLNTSWPRSGTDSGFEFQNTMSEVFGASVAKANLEQPGASSRFSGLAETAAQKIGGVKEWVNGQAAGLLGDSAGFESFESTGGDWTARLSSMLGGADIKKIGGSLSIVIGGYLGLVWLLRKINPRGNHGIPREVLEVVGNAPLDNRQNLQLVRLGSKLLLMIHGPDGTQPIGEVTDPAEVDHLVALCNGRTRTANSAVSRAVDRQQSLAHSGVSLPNLSANQQNNLTQLLSAINQTNHGNNIRSYEA